MNCVICICWITDSICGVEMNGMPWLIWYALNQTVPSLWEWLLIKGAWTRWMHATLASGYTYIFIAPLPNLIKIGDKLCTEQTISMAQTGFAPRFIAYPWGFSLKARAHVNCLVQHYAYTFGPTLFCLLFCLWSKIKGALRRRLSALVGHNGVKVVLTQDTIK